MVKSRRAWLHQVGLVTGRKRMVHGVGEVVAAGVTVVERPPSDGVDFCNAAVVVVAVAGGGGGDRCHDRDDACHVGSGHSPQAAPS